MMSDITADLHGSGRDDVGKAMNSVAGVLCMACAGSVWADGIRVQSPVPYSENSLIAGNIKAECPIGEQLAEFLRQFSAEAGIEIALEPAAPDAAQGRVLAMEIVDAQSTGNAWTGHLKSTAVRGTLSDNGVEVASFAARRISRGGFGAGFKGSCSVLGRTVRAIGKDVSIWLKQPVDGAQLGDL